jgi:hypothetical protein
MAGGVNYPVEKRVVEKGGPPQAASTELAFTGLAGKLLRDEQPVTDGLPFSVPAPPNP